MPRTQTECLILLEQLRWQGTPKCPYCGSTRSSELKSEQRYHCNGCFTSYSVTVGTVFHKTHIILPKWFLAIKLIMGGSKQLSVRQLATEIEVNKNTAAYMLARIRQAEGESAALLNQLVELLEEEDFG